MPIPQNINLVEADWWTQDGDDLANTLGTVFNIVLRENAWRTSKDEYHWGLYEGNGIGGITTRSRRNMTYSSATLPDNICKMGVDTLTAKVATIRPIPQVLTSKGNWKDQRRARKLRQFIQGEFFRQKVHQNTASRIIKDSLVGRAGVVQVFVEGKRPKIERVHPWTLFTDDWDAEFGNPMTMMRLRTMDRAKAMAKLGRTPALREKIKNAGRFSTWQTKALDEQRSSTVQRVELLEAWYRCADHDPDDKDHKCTGRHVIICTDAVLFEEDWKHDFFPFAVLTYDTPNTGYWGSGMVQTLEGYQVSADEANEKLDEAYRMSGKGVLLRDGSGIFKSDLTDGFRVIHAKPGPYDPTIFDMDLVNEHMRARPNEMIERGLNAVGVSQMAAQSKTPAGITAAVALQTLDDVESQRHIVFGRRFESWCMEVATLLIECVKEISEKFGDYEIKVPMRGAYLNLKWKDVEIDGFQLEMQSVGQLYSSFAGRLDKLKTLFDMDAIDKFTFMRELDAGDIQGELDLETVDRLRADEMIEAMLDADAPANDNNEDSDRNYLAPDAYLPLQWMHKRAHQRRNQAQMEGAPLYTLNLMTRLIDDLQYLIDKNAAPNPGAMPADGSPPVPQPPPPGAPPPDGGLGIPPMGLAPSGDQLMGGPPLPAAAPLAA